MWGLELLPCFLDFLIQAGICLSCLLAQMFKFAVVISEVRVEFRLVCQIECNGAVNLFKASTGKDWAMLSGAAPRRKAYTTESRDTRVPAIQYPPSPFSM